MTKEQIHNIYLHMTGKAEGLLEAGAEADFPVMFAEAIMEYNKPRELTDEEIVDALCLNDEDFMVYIATSPQAKEKLIQRGRAVLKKANEK